MSLNLNPGDLAYSHFRLGSFVDSPIKTGLIGTTSHHEIVIVIANNNDGWILIKAKCGIGWSRIRGFKHV